MFNLAIAPGFKQQLIESMKIYPFSICVDGDYRKWTLAEYSRIVDMCTSSSGTAEDLYNTFDRKLQELLSSDKPWNRCTSVGVNNTSVNIGVSKLE